MKKVDYNFNFDMDGVLVDLWGFIEKNHPKEFYLLNKSWLGLSDIEKKERNLAWKRLNDIENFWVNLPKMPDADELVKDIVFLFKNVGVLTATPRAFIDLDTSGSLYEKAKKGKLDWIKSNFPNYPRLAENFLAPAHAAEKSKYCKKNDFLLDDLEVNVLKWQDAGGIGVLHKNKDSSLNKIHFELLNIKSNSLKLN